ncbi:MAG: DUF4111 domain-containing protein [Burkholderiaceae bacterium]|jgi:streptomycin 3"-adenylyltransferase|nr:DUF4111 domain-containing protein [Burkholderiaceae bacterium]
MPVASPSLFPQIVSEQLSLVCSVLDAELGTSIIGMHVFGSVVDGGLQPFSDLDMLVTVSEPPAEEQRRAVLMRLLDVSAPPGASTILRPLEVTVLDHAQITPWRYPARRELQFGEWLREDLLSGVFEPPMADHDLAILITKVRSSSVTLRGRDASVLFQEVPPADLARALLDTVRQWNQPDDWAGDERNIVLALARCWFTACTGRICSKQEAATWVLGQVDERHRAVVANARAAYLGVARDELPSRPEAVSAFVRDARREIERQLAD